MTDDSGGLSATSRPYVPPSKLRVLLVMVDGEFTGANYLRSAVLSWSVQLFDPLRAGVPRRRGGGGGAASGGSSGSDSECSVERAPALPPTSVDDVFVDGHTVNLLPPPGTVMEPEAKRFFDERPHLLPALAHGAVRPEVGMRRLATFLRGYAEHYTLKLIAKPAGVDVGRLRFCLDAFAPDIRVPLHHSSVCLLTMQVTLQKAYGIGFNDMKRRICEERGARGGSAGTAHLPAEDCVNQIADYLTLQDMMRALR